MCQNLVKKSVYILSLNHYNSKQTINQECYSMTAHTFGRMVYGVYEIKMSNKALYHFFSI